MAVSPESLTGITQNGLDWENNHINTNVKYDFEVADYGAIVEGNIKQNQPLLHSFLYLGTMLPANIDMDTYKAGVAYAINVLPDKEKQDPIPEWLLLEIQRKILRYTNRTPSKITVDLHWNAIKLEQFEPHLYNLINQPSKLFNEASEVVAFNLGVIYGSMPYCLRAQTLAFPDQSAFDTA